MSMLRGSLGLLFAVAALAGCPPQPQPPSPDASDASPGPSPAPAPPSPPASDGAAPLGDQASQACATMLAIGCAEGKASNCADRVRAVKASNLTKLDLACVVASQNASQVRACGSIACTLK